MALQTKPATRRAAARRTATPAVNWSALAQACRQSALVWLGFLLATVVATFPLAFQIGRALPGKTIDGGQNVWAIWWARKALFDLHTNPFYTRYLYHPTGVDLYYHTLALGAAPFSIPLQFVMSPAAALVATFLLTTATAGWGAYLLAHYLVPNRLAACAAGLIFALNPYQLYHLKQGQLNFATICWIPLFVLFLLRATREARPAFGIGAGIMLALVSLTDWHYAFHCLIFTGLYLLWEAARGLRARRWRGLLDPALAVGVTGLTYAALIGPLVLQMAPGLRAPGYTVRPYAQVVGHSTDLLTLLLPNPLHPLWGGAITTIYHHVYEGPYSSVAAFSYVALALALLALALRRRAPWFWLGLFVLFTALSLGPELRLDGTSYGASNPLVPLPYRLFSKLPFANVSRSPGVFLKLGFLCLGIVVACSLDHLMRGVARRRTSTQALLVGVVAIALIGGEYLAAPFGAPPLDAAPAFLARLAATAPGGWGVLDVPTAKEQYNWYDATIHGWPIVGGNLSRDNPNALYRNSPAVGALIDAPPPLAERDIVERTSLGEVGEASLAADRIRWVIVRENRLTPDRQARVHDALRRIFGGRPPDYTGDGLTVYEVHPPPGILPVRFDDGWYDTERLPQNGQPYRWIAQEAPLHVYSATDTPVTVRFTAHNFATAYTLQVSVNGAPAASVAVPGGFAPAAFTTTLRAGDNVLTFAVTTPPHSAAELGLGSDQRQVSVGISELRIEAVP